MRIAPIAIVTVLAGSAALAADQAPPFAFSPVPRWQLPADQEPETDQICAALRKECPALKGVEYIHRLKCRPKGESAEKRRHRRPASRTGLAWGSTDEREGWPSRPATEPAFPCVMITVRAPCV